MNNLSIGEEIKIRDVKKLWNNFNEIETPLLVDCKNLKRFDGAGFQFLLYLFHLVKNTSEKYTISGLSDEVVDLMASFGYIADKGELEK